MATTYKLKTTKEDLCNKGFRYNKTFSEDGFDYYSLRLPVYKYNNSPVIECELIVALESGEVNINVFNSNSRSAYAPYYNNYYGGENKVLDTVNKNIESMLRKLGVKVRKK